MSHFKFVAAALLVALPVACSREQRDTETPENMTPASGYETTPTPRMPPAPTQAPTQAPDSPSAPSTWDTTGTSSDDSDIVPERGGSATDAGSPSPVTPDPPQNTGGTSSWNPGGTTTGGTGSGTDTRDGSRM